MEEVIIYTTPTCMYCKLTKAYFKEHNVKYKEIDVAKDQEAAMEMIEKSGQQGVPVIEIGDNIIIGFNKKAIDKALHIK